ncbi:CMGC family protein kinase [Tritrichomonas foetus]|uniref:CMGC family protein kinase n=1 Tax=Tritrichomonas foetus TaxID=1144522 RepID=A0A1J4J811_9EUKA|nr:CMGC family protein kinase [Tritrichomonas foetus]|eukprot:OHS95334.1 CMGC family protein kinase [Tritrichomonas foetus]
MRRFEKLEIIGNGAFGVVTKCRDKDTGDLVAIKMMKQKYSSFEECLQLKEVKSLRKIKHENVVKLLQVFRENDCLFLVFELLPNGSLLQTINTINWRGSKFSEPEIRYTIMQLLHGLNYVHRQGFFHRDIKPENLLWSGHTLKIADFGLAREIRSRPPYTEYVATRWYRAPEIILRHEFYNSPVDIWAVGAIMAELYLGKPIFCGTSETDQFYKICAVLGSPNSQNWPDGIKLANRLGIRLNNNPPVSLSKLMPDASPQAIDLISQMLRYDPSKRPSAQQALQHPFFKGDKCPPNFESKPTQKSPLFQNTNADHHHPSRKVNLFAKYLENNTENVAAGSLPTKFVDSLLPEQQFSTSVQTAKSRPQMISSSFLKSMQSFDHMSTINENNNPFELPNSSRKISQNPSLRIIDTLIKPISGNLQQSGHGISLKGPTFNGSKTIDSKFRLNSLFS